MGSSGRRSISITDNGLAIITNSNDLTKDEQWH